MKRIITLSLAIIAISITGCTFNVGTSSNTPNVNATNTTNSAPTTAENKPATTANTAATPKKVEAAPATKTDSPLSSAKSVRVQFAGGETSTSVTKDIPANGSVEFLMNVQKGQTMDYTIGYDFNDSDIIAYLGEPGDQDNSIPAAPKAPQSFVVKKSGDHRLEVANTTKKKVTITLYLDIE